MMTHKQMSDVIERVMRRNAFEFNSRRYVAEEAAHAIMEAELREDVAAIPRPPTTHHRSGFVHRVRRQFKLHKYDTA
jgi:hypothetical protein